jgi:peptide chain release factor 2/peptide chain release factor
MSRWTLLVSAGVGPVEVRRFVALLGCELAKRCEARGLILLSTTLHGDEKEPCSVELEVEGDAAAVVQGDLGTHVLVARSQRRNRRSRKRWFAGVSLHPASSGASGRTIPAGDVEVKTSRSGGPGGQHVNTTDSAVRVLHKPTGISVRVASERSQHQNRRVALKRLGGILARRDEERQSTRKRGLRSSHYQFERGSAVRQWTVDERSGALRGD